MLRVWTPSTKLALAACFLAVFLAYVLVRRSPAAALALPLLLPSLWLITRQDVGVLVGLVVILTLPSWQTVGTAQATVLRLAALAAASTALFARRRVRLCATDFAVALFVLVIFAGWLILNNTPHAGRVVSIELTPLGFYIGARAMPPSSLPRVMATTLVAGSIGALTVIYEYLAGHTVFLDSATYKWNATSSTIFRPGGIFGGPPQASTVLCVVIIFGLGALSRMRGRVRLLGVACLVVCGTALFLTFTRAALIGVGAGMLLYLWLTGSPVLRPTRVLWAVGIVVLASLFVLPLLHKSTSVQQGFFRSGTLSAREGYWSTAAPIIVASPKNFVFGIGTAALETPTLSPSSSIPADLAVRPQVFTTSLHSEYVTSTVENGIIGLAALALFVLVPLGRAVRIARSTADPGAAAIAGSVAAIAIVMSVDTVLLDGPSFAVILVCAGFAAIAQGLPSVLYRSRVAT